MLKTKVNPKKEKAIQLYSYVSIYLHFIVFILQGVSQNVHYFDPTISFLRNYTADVLIIMYNDI